MRYTLMHKDVPVVQMELDDVTGSIRRIGDAYRLEHLPVGIAVRKGQIERASLNEWWLNRSIPASRSGVREALEILKLPDTTMLLTKCFGLSLSDQYWVRPDGSDMTWGRINFFDNPFSDDVGDALFGKRANAGQLDLHSPDNTSDGCLKKRWKIIHGTRCLVKAGSNPFQQQPFNEVIASAVMRRLNIPHTPYRLLWDGDIPYSVCDDFITPDTELVSAWYVMQTAKRDNSTSVYQHYVQCCTALGVPDITQALDRMIVLDYIIANEDRHQNNFGLVRHAETLEWLGAAPIYDSGSSLGYDKLAGQIAAGKGIVCKPFKKIHEEQLKLVTSFDWIDFSALDGLEQEMKDILAGAGDYIDETRQNVLCTSVRKRIEHLQEMSLGMEQRADDIEQDVSEDIAEDYTPKMNL